MALTTVWLRLLFIGVTAALLSVYVAESTGSTGDTLYLVALAPHFVEGSPRGYTAALEILPAVNLAVEHINNHPDVLRGYHLSYIEGDSGCNDTSQTFRGFIEHVLRDDGKRVVGIIGPACSEATLAIAPLMAPGRIDLIHVGTATTPELTEQTGPVSDESGSSSSKFPNTFRVVSSALAYIDVMLGLIDHTGWRRVAALFDGERQYFQATYSEFASRISREYLIYTSPVLNTLLPLKDIKDDKLRVIFVFAGSPLASRIICLAYHMDLVYPLYQWIFHDRNISTFEDSVEFEYDGKVFKCSSREMKIAISGAILNIFRLAREDTSTTKSGLTYEDYYAQLIERVNTTDLYANAYYDATWTIALALNNSIPYFGERGLNLSQYQYGDKEATIAIREQLLKLEFEGMLGKVQFNRMTGDSNTTVIDVFQIHKGGPLNRIGAYCPSCDHEAVTFSDELTFIDDHFEERHIVRVPDALVALVFAVLLIVAIATSLLHAINIIYRNFGSVKATSTGLNHLIFSGCYLFFFATASFVTQRTQYDINDVTFGIRCSTFFWCFSLGISLIFGTVCAKTWRIYKIFTIFKREEIKLISDQALALFVTFLIFLDVILNTMWNLINPWRVNRERRFDGVDTIEVQLSCTCDNLPIWVASTFLYKGLQIAIVVYLQILTRQVHRKDFKHSKNINILAYSLTFLYGLGVPVLFLLGRSSEARSIVTFLLVSTVFIGTVVLCQVFLFLPAVIPLLKLKLSLLKWYIKPHHHD